MEANETEAITKPADQPQSAQPEVVSSVRPFGAWHTAKYFTLKSPLTKSVDLFVSAGHFSRRLFWRSESKNRPARHDRIPSRCAQLTG